jgi:gag-polypeptide of LTR copia-type
MELLKAHNWMPWKRRMLAVLRDLGLEKYIAKDAKAPESADKSKPTNEEVEAQKKWKEGDTKAHTRIELSIGDAEMIHISGAETARQMWDQLTTVKESKGRLGVLATRCALYQITAEEGFDMVEHVSKLRKLQEELHLMENKVPDEDFVMILITLIVLGRPCVCSEQPIY